MPVEIRGTEELIKNLGIIEAKIVIASKEAINEASDSLVRTAKDRLVQMGAIETGALRESIHKEGPMLHPDSYVMEVVAGDPNVRRIDPQRKEGDKFPLEPGRIRATSEYAAPVEFGGKNVQTGRRNTAKPYMRTALAVGFTLFPEVLKEKIKSVLQF